MDLIERVLDKDAKIKIILSKGRKERPLVYKFYESKGDILYLNKEKVFDFIKKHAIFPIGVKKTLLPMREAIPFTCSYAMDEHDMTLKPLFKGGNKERCFEEPRTLLVGVIADCNYCEVKGGPGLTIRSILQTWNVVSQIYEEAFNLAIKISEIQIFPQCEDKEMFYDNPTWNRACELTYQMDQRLSDFSEWISIKEKSRSASGLWHLMTGCPSAVTTGLSWGGMVCSKASWKSSPKDLWIAATGVSSLSAHDEVQVVAHELGHNMGAVHDCSYDCSACTAGAEGSVLCEYPSKCCSCQPSSSLCDCQGQYLMSKTTNMQSYQFSPCTKAQICSTLRHYGTCLLTTADPLISKNIHLNQCGNRLSEEGEECDCGTEEQCSKDPCCQSGCKLRAGAMCSDYNHPCCHNCQLLPYGTPCRYNLLSSSCSIDKSPICDGKVSSCPFRIRSECAEGGVKGVCSPEFGKCITRNTLCMERGARFGMYQACNQTNSCALFCLNSQSECIDMGEQVVNGLSCFKYLFKGQCFDGQCALLSGEFIKKFLLIGFICSIPMVLLILSVCGLRWRFKRNLFKKR